MLTNEETKIIDLLKTEGRQNLVQISKKLKINKSSVFYQLKRLLDEGLITKSTEGTRTIFYEVENPARIRKYIEERISELESVLTKTPRLSPTGKKPKLVFTDSYILPEELLNKLRKNFEVFTYPDSKTHISEETFIFRAKDADIIVVFWGCPITKEVLLQCKNLKAIVCGTIDTSYISHEDCDSLGIKIYGLDPKTSYKRAARREFILAALLGLLRPIHYPANDLKLGKFEYRYLEAHEIRGMKVGIVGTKQYASDIIPLIRSLGAEIRIANPDNPNVDPNDLGVISMKHAKWLKENYLKK